MSMSDYRESRAAIVKELAYNPKTTFAQVYGATLALFAMYKHELCYCSREPLARSIHAEVLKRINADTIELTPVHVNAEEI